MFNNRLSIDFTHTKQLAKKNKKRLLTVFSQIIDSGIFLNGTHTKKLERNLVKFLNGGYLNLVASGHDALLLSLSSLKLTKNDEVVVPANSFVTAFAVALSGAKIVLVDVDENGQIDPEQVKKKITNKTKAIIIVHLYGLVGEIDQILSLPKQKKIFVIEDAAQSFGSIYKNKFCGTLADIGCFSFYPTKNLPTLGDGGAVWTKHKKIFDYIHKAKSYGEKIKYHSEFISGHSRMPEIQAGSTNLFLKNIAKEGKKRTKLYEYYQDTIREKKLNKQVRILNSNINSYPYHHLLTIETKARDRLASYLKKRNVETHVHYPIPIHLSPAFSYLGFKKGNFPIAERLANNVLSLPFHQYLTKNQIEYIVSQIRSFYYE